MSEAVLGALLIGSMFVLLALGVEVSIALGLVGLAGLLYLKGFTVASASSAPSPGPTPFRAMARWVGFLPGGLAVASIFSCGVFAAVSGSSVATAAAIGMIASPRWSGAAIAAA